MKLTGEQIAAIEGLLTAVESGKTHREIAAGLDLLGANGVNRVSCFFSILRALGVEVARPRAVVSTFELAEFRAWKAAQAGSHP